MREEVQLIKESAREFLLKEVAGREVSIDRNGLDPGLLSRVRDQGFMTAVIPQEDGGSGLDRDSYLAVLNEMAKYSGSLAAAIFMFNSIEYPLIRETGSKSLLNEFVSSAGQIALDCRLFSYGGSGSAGDLYMFPDSRVVATLQNDVIRIYRKESENPEVVSQLGFRGIRFGHLHGPFGEEVGSFSGSGKFISGLMERTSEEIASIVLGISSTALAKAVEYSKVRYAFGSPLKAFQPVAFPLAMRMAQLSILESFVFSGSEKSRLELIGEREISLDFARDTTKLALQTHGGYGYIEDFGVEMLYRDALFAGSFFWPRSEHMRSMATALYEDEAGSI